MSLKSIPHGKTTGFPEGVSEKSYRTIEDMTAFLDGLEWVGDFDVTHGEVFIRDGQFVVRVRIGEDLSDDDDLDDTEEESKEEVLA